MKKNLIFIIAIIVISAGSFYGGMKFEGNKKSIGGNFSNFQNLSDEQRQQMMQQNGMRTGQNGAGFINGEIIAKDDKSITVKLRDGGSKIVFFSDSTEISKFASGAANDLEIGKTITANGTTNQDGSITAQSIQLRPETLNLLK